MLYRLSTTQLEKQLREIKADHSGRLRLGISVQRSMQILPKVIPVFRQKYPKVTLDLTERGSASLEELLQKGTILVFCRHGIHRHQSGL